MARSRSRRPSKWTTNHSALASNSKNPQTNKKKIDIISNLPESVLSHILSWLPTKDAVATSILSKRWRFLWTSITSLDFYDGPMWYLHCPAKHKRQTMKLINNINKVLLLSNPSSIKKLRLNFTQFSEDSHVNIWICAALGRKVVELDLSLYGFVREGRPIELPQRLYFCNTLEVLNLTSGIMFNIPSLTSVCFPNLKALELNYANFEYNHEAGSLCFPNLKIIRLVSLDYSNDDCLNRFLGSCPALEDLCIKKTGLLSSVNICSLTVKTLQIHCISDVPEFKLHIDAPSLEYLKIACAKIPSDLLIENLFSLIQAEIELYCWGMPKEIHNGSGHSALELLRGLGHVKRLNLLADTTSICCNGFQGGAVAPVFQNLTRLQIPIRCHDWYLLQNLLENSNNLQHILSSKEYLSVGGVKESWTEPEHVPKCLLLSLKTIQMGYFCGCNYSLELVKYILKNAKVLEKMTIAHLHSASRNPLQQKISMFPRGSAKCQVELEFT